MTKAALITGGGVRLGRALAMNLARGGRDIALHYNSSLKAAEKTAEEIRSLGKKCRLIACDLSQVEMLEGLIQEACATFPELDVLINNASVYASGSIRETTPESFDRQFAVNLRAPFFLMQAFAKEVAMGNIVNILDNKIGFSQYHYAAYLLAKKSLGELSKMAAVELAPHIRVNGIAPGVILPAKSRSEDYIRWRIMGIPLQNQGTPHNISQAVDYLLGNDFVSGQILVVDGAENISFTGQNAESHGQANA